jgi:hypothetical protein
MTQVGTIFGARATGRQETMQNPVFYAATGGPANSAGKSKTGTERNPASSNYKKIAAPAGHCNHSALIISLAAPIYFNVQYFCHG